MVEPGRRSRIAVPAALVALTTGAAVLRFATLDLQSFWTDEAVTVLLVRSDFSDLLAAIPETERTPPLYYLLAWGWTKVLGSGEVGLRSLSALVGTLSVPVVFAAGRELASARAGLIAAAIVATHPLLVWYSQEARAYSLLVLAVAVAFVFFVRTRNTIDARAPLFWSLASVAALATHYVAVFVVGAMAVLLLLARRDRAVRLAVAGTAVGGLALAPLAAAQARSTAWLEESAVSSRIAFAGKQLLVGANAPYDRLAAIGVAALYVVGGLLLVRSGDRVAKRAAVVGGSVAALTFTVPVLLASVGPDYFVGRNTLAVLVPFAAAAAIALGAPPRRLGLPLATAVCLVGLTLVAVVFTEPSRHRADWRGAASVSRQGAPDGPRLLVVVPDWGGWFGRIPVSVYLPDARSVDADLVEPMEQFHRLLDWDSALAAGTVRTRTVVELTVGSVAYPVVLDLPPVFHPAEVTSTGQYTVTRYESPQPVDLRLERLIPSEPYHADVAYLVLDR